MERATDRDPRYRAVVTGMGAVSALGLDIDTFWAGLYEGRGGIRTIQSFETEGFRTTVASEIDDAVLKPALAAWRIRPTDRSVDIGLLAAAHALENAGLAARGEPVEPRDAAVIVGTGVGPLGAMYEGTRRFLSMGVAGVRPSTVPTVMINAVTAQISLRFRLTGPNYVLASACTSSTAAIGDAFRRIRAGATEMVVTGGTDAVMIPHVFAAWNNLGVMSSNPDPDSACRPFDAARDGLVLGEGAAILVVESLAAAERRGAEILGEILGFGESSDALHLTRPDSDGQVRAIEAALASAGVAPAEIGHVNAHGTATPANDPCEATSIRRVLGESADHALVASSKSYFGHTLGASGALETTAALLALKHGVVPGNRNLDNPDPACKISLVGREPAPLVRPLALKNSFGFGGHNAVLVLGPKPE